MMMRRLKTDKTIISDLPDKIEQDEFAMLTPQQAALYKKVLDESMKVIEDFDETDSKQLETGVQSSYTIFERWQVCSITFW